MPTSVVLALALRILSDTGIPVGNPVEIVAPGDFPVIAARIAKFAPFAAESMACSILRFMSCKRPRHLSGRRRDTRPPWCWWLLLSSTNNSTTKPTTRPPCSRRRLCSFSVTSAEPYFA